MNNIVNALCIGMLGGSLLSLFQSLFKTTMAYKRHKELKELEKTLTKSKKNEAEKIDEILEIQKEIIEIIDSMDNSDKDNNLTLEKEREKLKDNYLKLKQVTEKKLQVKSVLE